ncbi:MAG: RsbU-domain-containing protein [Ktedonobacterales bacterium]|jgi:PAS domain S-box-containing protein|nr:MAG: RsbU-domain-containing protein [Ktedonobacterales bacterium]
MQKRPHDNDVAVTPQPSSYALDDPARLAALQRTALLDTPAEESFDRLARLASRALHVPIALVKLISADRQFFKSSVGLPEPWASIRELPSTQSFCHHVIATGGPLMIADARTDPLGDENAAVQKLNAIAYAGVPLVTADGLPIGTFCVMDTQPRHWTQEEMGILRDLSASVMVEIELRVAQREAERREQEVERERHAKIGALEALNERMGNILESITDAFFALDADWRFTYVNAEAERILRRPRKELLGQSIWQMFPDVLERVFHKQYRRAVEQHKVVAFEAYYAPDQVWADVRVYPTRNAQGGYDGITVYFRDITKRKRAEEAYTALLARERAARKDAQDIEARLRAVLDVLPVGVVMADAQGRPLEMNAAFKGIWGEPAPPVDGVAQYGKYRGWWAGTDHLIAPEEWGVARAVRYGETVINKEVDIETFDAKRKTVLTSAAPIRDTTGAILGGVIAELDVTQHRQLERERAEMLNTVAHEMKTPLTSIKAMAQLIRKRARRGAPQEPAHFEQIDRSTERLERLVNDLVDAARLDTNLLIIELAHADLKTICEQAAEEQIALAGRVVTLELPGRPLDAEVDQQRIGQVLANLLSNALKYSPDGSPVLLRLAREGNTARFEVVDRGPGIPVAARAQLFDRFYRVPNIKVLHGSGVGLGLGLYICHRLVELHGGQLGVESVVGEGTTFWFTLPLARS